MSGERVTVLNHRVRPLCHTQGRQRAKTPSGLPFGQNEGFAFLLRDEPGGQLADGSPSKRLYRKKALLLMDGSEERQKCRGRKTFFLAGFRKTAFDQRRTDRVPKSAPSAFVFPLGFEGRRQG